MPELELVAPFVAGLASTLHCVGMCGPLALAAGAAGGPRAGPLAYLAGKTGSYLLVGTTLALGGGILGAGLSPLVPRVLLGATGLFFVVQGIELIRPGTLPRVVVPAQGAPEALRRLFGSLREAGGAPAALGIGMLSGLLPCPLSWGVAAWAAGTASPLQGAGIMIAFGLGTAPGLLLVSRLAATRGSGRRPALRVLSGGAWLLVGLHLLRRVLPASWVAGGGFW